VARATQQNSVTNLIIYDKTNHSPRPCYRLSVERTSLRCNICSSLYIISHVHLDNYLHETKRNTMNSDLTLEQKLWLAGRLPEVIGQHPNGFYWIGSTNGFITDKEWLWVVAEVEGRLNQHDSNRCTGYLLMELGEENSASIVSFTSIRTATASQRCSALIKVMGL
jgi:hypothetical protein